MRTTNFDVIAASAPLNREASVARDGSGETWGFEVHEQISHWKAPPLPTHRRPHGMSDLSGRSFGLLKVLRFHGYREGKNAPALWLVRCSCGDYETRRHAKLVKGGDADSWVAEFISWWIDQETGLPIAERAGKVRWFVRINDALIWADDPAELEEKHPGIPPKSATFIPAKLTDNAALMAADPGYMANLLALPKVERERLLGGNWKIRAAAGLLFKRSWVRVVDAAPTDLRIVRGWDLASTPKVDGNDPDWTAGTKIGQSRSTGRYIVLHHVRDRDTPHKIEALISNTASQDGREVEISLPQDPGQAGKAQVATLIKMLSGYTARATPETGDKETRFGPFSAQCEAGNVDVLRGPWNEEWFMELEAFPDAAHDDDADSTARAFNTLSLETPSTVALFLSKRHR